MSEANNSDNSSRKSYIAPQSTEELQGIISTETYSTSITSQYFRNLENLRRIAKLANLPLTNQEEERYSEQLSNILDYIEQLNQIDTSQVEPTFNVIGQSNVMREDETTASLPQEEALSNAPKKQNGMFVTKGVFEE